MKLHRDQSEELKWAEGGVSTTQVLEQQSQIRHGCRLCTERRLTPGPRAHLHLNRGPNLGFQMLGLAVSWILDLYLYSAVQQSWQTRSETNRNTTTKTKDGLSGSH